MPAAVQITAEQLLREAKERELELQQPVSTNIMNTFNIFPSEMVQLSLIGINILHIIDNVFSASKAKDLRSRWIGIIQTEKKESVRRQHSEESRCHHQLVEICRMGRESAGSTEVCTFWLHIGKIIHDLRVPVSFIRSCKTKYHNLCEECYWWEMLIKIVTVLKYLYVMLRHIVGQGLSTRDHWMWITET